MRIVYRLRNEKIGYVLDSLNTNSKCIFNDHTLVKSLKNLEKKFSNRGKTDFFNIFYDSKKRKGIAFINGKGCIKKNKTGYVFDI